MKPDTIKVEPLVSGAVYVGTKSTHIPIGKHIVIDSPTEVQLFTVNELGEFVEQAKIKGTYNNKSRGLVHIKAKKDQAWSIRYQDKTITYDASDPEPFAVPVSNPVSTIDRMRQMIAAQVMNELGAQSDEIETLEEMMDFDIDGDGEIGSQYEDIEPMPEEYLQPPGDEVTQDPAPSSGSETPLPKDESTETPNDPSAEE